MISVSRLSKLFLCPAMVALLGACGGGGGGTVLQPPTIPPVQPTPFPVTQTTAETLIDTYLDSDGRLLPAFSPLDSTRIATSGTAEYRGFLTGAADGTDLVASFAVRADFAASELAATAGAFQNGAGDDLDGSITGNGSITRDAASRAPQLQVTLSGTVDNLPVDLLLDGALVVASGSTSVLGMAGQAEGIVGSAVFENGRFAAE